MNEIIDYAKTFLGLPYIYGGNSPIVGMDCSGLGCEIGKSAGVVPHNADLTAQGLYNLFVEAGATNVPAAGSFAFFGEGAGKIRHVGFMINPYQMIEAGGGDSSVTSVAAAILKNAFIRIRPVASRSDLVATLKPRYNKIGLL